MEQRVIAESTIGQMDDAALVRLELQTDERLLLTGRATRFRLPKSVYFAVFFGLFFTVFAAFWITVALTGVATVKSQGPSGSQGAVKLLFRSLG